MPRARCNREQRGEEVRFFCLALALLKPFTNLSPFSIATVPAANSPSHPKTKTRPQNVSARSKTLSGKDRIRSARAPLALLGRGHRRGGRRGPDLRHVRIGVAGHYVGVVGHRARLGVGVGRGLLVSLALLRGLVSRKTTVPTTTRRRFFRSMIGRSATTGAARRGGKEVDEIIDGCRRRAERASERSPANDRLQEFYVFPSRQT